MIGWNKPLNHPMQFHVCACPCLMMFTHAPPTHTPTYKMCEPGIFIHMGTGDVCIIINMQWWTVCWRYTGCVSPIAYTADFGHSGPRLAIASCGHSGKCRLRHWIQSHDRAQYGSCTLGPVWIRMAPHIGTCHSGQYTWQLSLGPRVAATWLFIVIY